MKNMWALLKELKKNCTRYTFFCLSLFRCVCVYASVFNVQTVHPSRPLYSVSMSHLHVITALFYK